MYNFAFVFLLLNYFFKGQSQAKKHMLRMSQEMQRLIPLFRQNATCKQFLAPMLRGAKKKKGDTAAAAEVESNDLINIYKEKTDPEIKDIEEYPPWLFELINMPKNHAITMKGWLQGHDEDLLQPNELRTFSNHLIRRKIIENNTYKRTLKPDLDDEHMPDYGIKGLVKAEDEMPVEVEEDVEEEDEEEDEPRRK